MRTTAAWFVVSFLTGCVTPDQQHHDEDTGVRTTGDASYLLDANVPPFDARPDAPDIDADLVQVLDSTIPDSGPPDPTRWFDDITARSLPRWERVPVDDYRTYEDRMSGGVCVLDVDGSGPVDLFFTARGAGNSRLFVASTPGAWVDRTAEFKLNRVGDAIGCLAFDADGDDDDDLLVTRVGGVELYLLHDGHFVQATALIDATFDRYGMYTSAAAADLDGDSDLDLVIGGFLTRDQTLPLDRLCLASVPCAADINRHTPIRNHLLLRQADGRYVDVTAYMAPDLTRAEPTLCVAIGDFLEEGRPSIYVGNDLGSRYFDRLLSRRDDGTFEDVALESGFATNSRGHGIDTMGFASGDFDRNGKLEHAATSFENDPTALFVCPEPGECEDRGLFAGLRATKDTFRWGVAFLDVNLDGAPDIFEATGHFYSTVEIEDLGFRGAELQAPNLLLNSGAGSLSLIIPEPDDGLARRFAARGIARADLNDDGRPDIVLATAKGAPALLLNMRPPQGAWLTIELVGRAPNTRAIGAQVRVATTRGVLLAEQRAGEGYLGSFDRRLFFGLGRSVEHADITVRWPSGLETNARVDVNHAIRIFEP